MGLSPSGDWFNMKSDTLISGLENILKSVDDLLFQADSLENLEKNSSDNSLITVEQKVYKLLRINSKLQLY